jgi:FkbM family methyltransferase
MNRAFRNIKGRITSYSLPFPIPVDGLWFVGTNLQNWWHGWNEKPTADYIRRNLKRGQSFVDIGANYGFYSVLAGSLGAKVISYEPDDLSFKRLRRNLWLNGVSSELHKAAVTDYDGTIEFYIEKDGSGLNSTVPGVVQGRKIEVRAKICSARYDLCKIDVEGAELSVLKGMKHRGKVICEFRPLGFDLSGGNPKAFLNDVRALGWRIEDIEEGIMSDDALTTKARRNGTLNILLCP